MRCCNDRHGLQSPLLTDKIPSAGEKRSSKIRDWPREVNGLPI